jgi:hypothetical protein
MRTQHAALGHFALNNRFALLAVAVFVLTTCLLERLLPPQPRWVQEIAEDDYPADLPHDGRLLTHAFSREGNLVALLPSGRFLDMSTGRDAPSLPRLGGGAAVRQLQYGTGAAFCLRDRVPASQRPVELVRVDLHTGQAQVLGQWPSVGELIASPDGHTLAVRAGTDSDFVLALFASSGELRWEVRLPPGSSRLVGLSPDGASLAVVCDEDGWDAASVAVLDARTGLRRCTIPVPRPFGLPVDIRFTPDGRSLVIPDHTGTRSCVRLHDAASGALRADLPGPGPEAGNPVPAIKLVSSVDGRVLLGCVLGQPDYQVYDLAHWRPLLSVPCTHPANFRFSPDCRLLAVLNQKDESRDWSLTVYATEDGRRVAELKSVQYLFYPEIYFPSDRALLVVKDLPDTSPSWWQRVRRLMPVLGREADRAALGMVLLDPQTGAEQGRIPFRPARGGMDLKSYLDEIEGMAHAAPDGQTLLVRTEKELVCWDLPPARRWGPIIGRATATACLAWGLARFLAWRFRRRGQEDEGKWSNPGAAPYDRNVTLKLMLTRSCSSRLGKTLCSNQEGKIRQRPGTTG